MSKVRKPFGSFHKHIDNGGVSIKVVPDKDAKFKIKIDTSYLDYPSVAVEIGSWGHLTYDDLHEIGLMFLRAAEAAGKTK